MLRACLIAVFLVPYIPVAAFAGVVAARVTGSLRTLYRLGHWGAGVVLVLAGTKVRVLGKERIGDGRNMVVIANHASHLDAAALLQGLGLDFKAIIKRELLRLPFFGSAMASAGFVPVARGDRTQGMQAVSAAASSLAEGHCFLVFPEGTRSATGALLPFKRGGFVAAIEARSRVLPVAVSGTRALLPKGAFRVRAGEVQLRVLDPVDAGLYSYADRERLVALVRDGIARALAEADASGGDPERG